MQRRFTIPLFFAALLALAGCGGEVDNNVLFIGNSYTHTNNMPTMVEEIADANGLSVNTTMIAPGGAFLHEHNVNPEVIAAIQSGEYDTVVFQEQSVAPSLATFAQENTLPAAASLDALADGAGVRVIWYQTWGHLNGFPAEGHATYESMQTAIIATYNNIQSQNGGQIARVGETWERARTSVPTTLYSPDGSHPSPAGSYLAALEITEAIMLQPVTEAPSVDGVDEEVANILANA